MSIEQRVRRLESKAAGADDRQYLTLHGAGIPPFTRRTFEEIAKLSESKRHESEKQN